MLDIDLIRAAAARIAGRVHRTPVYRSHILGARLGIELVFKCECFQKTGSFKSRGALNKVLTLSDVERGKGLVTVSAGNHAQAVAWAAQQVGAPCAVVMPADAPQSKLDAVKGYGAEIVLHTDRATLFDRLQQVRKQRGMTFIHPFDDPVVLAGAGTTGLEIVEDVGDVDWVLVPVGGGGLLGGVATAIKSMSPATRVVAVELAAGPGLGPALHAGKPVPVERPHGTIADGMTPPFVGALPLEIAQRAVDDVVTVSERAIIEAMKLLMSRVKLFVEGSGAATTAALLEGRVKPPAGSRVVAVVSGGNVDVSALGRAFAKDAERAAAPAETAARHPAQ